MATAQVNARIDAQVKSRGDFGLAQANRTPTQAVRALWGYIGDNAHDGKALAKLFDLLEGRNAEQQSREATRRTQLAEDGPQIFDAALATMGLSSESLPALSDDELLEQAFLEKARERGTGADL